MSAGRIPCPCCDLDEAGAGMMVGLATGVSLGAAFGDIQAVTDRVCERHRPLWDAALFYAQVAVNAPPEARP